MGAEYEAIFRRKAVRKYKPERVSEKALGGLLEKTAGLTPLRPETPVAFRVLGAGEIKGMSSAKAPHYLAVYSDKDNLVNAAFMLQQMDLWLSSEGYGSCWLGMAHPSEKTSANGLPFAIMLAFGVPAEEPVRKNAAEFNRKPLSGITDISGMDGILEAVRLAPSGVNRQPWFVTGGESALRLHCKLNKGVSGMLFGSLSDFDMGIALCHLWLAAAEAGKSPSARAEEGVTSPHGYGYVYTVFLGR